MSEENFDRKIREKLSRHNPKYEKGSWEAFQKMLPAPWYIQLFRDYGAWLFGGVATTALVLSTVYQFQKTNRLNEEISTLTEKLNQTTVVDTVYLESNHVDTVVVKEFITQYVPVEREKIVYVNSENSSIPNGQTNTDFAVNEASPVKEVSAEAEIASPKDAEQSGSQLTNNPDKSIEKSLTQSTSEKPELSTSQSLTNEENRTVLDQDSKSESPEKQLEVVKESETREVANIALEKEQKEEEITVSDSLLALQMQEITEMETEAIDRDIPEEKPKKKINWPKMRAGVTSDFVGFRNLLTGPTVEVFLSDKISFNLGTTFSGQIETRHPFAMDFNKDTGKRFEEEYERYIPGDAPMIKDISIKTSLIKMPINFNYYINTWSRFNFMVSAGTNLDLSVYQDVNFLSGTLGQQISRRFEAKAKPKVFNNLFYGMGVQYQYKSLVAQLTPYFEYKFRSPDYFHVPGNVGISGSLKFQFGK
ncbi:hypothetical protein [Jiulongibacter sp. NS-SX5]|uniref:hypothetical protein n=1 Tax=Jiulongibacter sp. NS-SX5 TaxID=3463854 RepID=UPI0040580467